MPQVCLQKISNKVNDTDQVSFGITLCKSQPCGNAHKPLDMESKAQHSAMNPMSHAYVMQQAVSLLPEAADLADTLEAFHDIVLHALVMASGYEICV